MDSLRFTLSHVSRGNYPRKYTNKYHLGNLPNKEEENKYYQKQKIFRTGCKYVFEDFHDNSTNDLKAINYGKVLDLQIIYDFGRSYKVDDNNDDNADIEKCDIKYHHDIMTKTGEIIKKFVNVRRLEIMKDFWSNKFTSISKWMKSLETLKYLEHIKINIEIYDDSLFNFINMFGKRLKSIKFKYIEQNKLKNSKTHHKDLMKKYIDVLSQSTILESLEIRNACIKDKDTIDKILSIKTLKYLSLDISKESDVKLFSYACNKIMTVNNNLKYLSLLCHHISNFDDDLMQYFIDTKLEYLNIYIEPNNMKLSHKFLPKVIMENKNLKKINLHYNLENESNVIALISALKKNTTLEEFYCYNYKFDRDIFLKLAFELFNKNKTLKRFEFGEDCNFGSDEQKKNMIECLKYNHVLQNFFDSEPYDDYEKMIHVLQKINELLDMPINWGYILCDIEKQNSFSPNCFTPHHKYKYSNDHPLYDDCPTWIKLYVDLFNEFKIIINVYLLCLKRNNRIKIPKVVQFMIVDQIFVQFLIHKKQFGEFKNLFMTI